MTSRSKSSRLLRNGLMDGKRVAFTMQTERRSSSRGAMNTVSARTRSSSAKPATSRSAVSQRCVSLAAQMLMGLCGLLLTPLATANTWSAADAEIGASYSSSTQPAFIARASAGVDRFSITALASSVRGDPSVLLASVRYSGDGWSVDAGRIGVSLGLTPPAYSATVPLASDPDIYPEINRALIRAVGLPGVGLGLTLTDGRVKYSVRAYRPSKAIDSDVAVISTPGSRFRDAGPLTPDECTACNFIKGLTGIDLNPVFAPNQQPVTIERQINNVVQAGVEWSNPNWRLVADGLRAEVNGHAVGVGIIGSEYSNQWITAGGQFVRIDHANTGSAYLYYPGEMLKPYVRYAAYSGAYEAREVGAGMVLTLDRLSLRGGYERVELVSPIQAYNEGPTMAASWRL